MEWTARCESNRVEIIFRELCYRNDSNIETNYTERLVEKYSVYSEEYKKKKKGKNLDEISVIESEAFLSFVIVDLLR